MSVRIRLSRIGKKHAPFYRIIAVDSRKKRDGAFLADIGTYDSLKSTMVTFDEQTMNHWLSVGAQQSLTVKKIVQGFKKTQAPVEKPAAKPAKKRSAAKKKADS